MLVQLINNSPYIILGKVVQVNDGEACIKIEEVLKGEIAQKQINLPSFNGLCSPYPCSNFTLNSRVIVFLVRVDSTYCVKDGGIGIVELADKTEPILRQGILDYLKIIENKKNQRFRLNDWEIGLLEKNIDFIGYGYNLSGKLDKKQQKRIYDVFKSSDTLKKSLLNYDYLIHCCNRLCLYIPIYKDSCLAKFTNQLIETKSAGKAEDLMQVIYFIRKKDKLLKLLIEFREKADLYHPIGKDIIDDEMKQIISRFLKITNYKLPSKKSGI
ncbi:MAG: hypothetical protein WCP69_08355 [Bacteroidota bacterium]